VKNIKLFENFRRIAQKNLGKAFPSFFALVVLLSFVSLIFGGSGLYLFNHKGEASYVLVFCYLLIFAGIFISFLFISGFAIMLLRMARDEYVTFGYILYGFFKIKTFAPVALIFTFLTGLVTVILVIVTKLISIYSPSLVDYLSQKFNQPSILLLIAVISAVITFFVWFGQVFIFFIKYDNPNKTLIKASFLSSKLVVTNFFKLVGFMLLAGGRNLILAIFYFGVMLSFSTSTDVSIYSVLRVLFNFLYFVNIYKALTLIFLSIPVFYNELTNPKIEINISLKKDADIIDDSKNSDEK